MSETNITQADTGLGTTFERWALNRVLVNLWEKYHFQSVLEGPGDGMTGINGLNSLILGLQGLTISLVLDNEQRAAFARQVWQIHAPQVVPQIEVGSALSQASHSVDLVWNFNVLTRFNSSQTILAEMARISRRYIFFCVPNAQNYSFWLHRWHHRVAKAPWDHGDVTLMRPAPWQRTLNEMGLTVKEIVYLDCPWWPDIVDLGQLISDFFPFLQKTAQKAKPENRMKWEAATLPYYQPQRYPEVHQQMAKLAYFENSQINWLKRLFAHHVGVFAEL
jgi:hypothetical protein